MSARQRRLARAYHEAGHVVMARALSLRVVGISLDPNLTYAGRIENEIKKLVIKKRAVDLDRLHRRTEKKVMTLMAGPVAQRRLGGPGHTRFGAFRDRQLALRVLASISDTARQTEAHIQYVNVAVEELMTPDLLAAVREVASALVSNGALAGWEVVAICRRQASATAAHLPRNEPAGNRSSGKLGVADGVHGDPRRSSAELGQVGVAETVAAIKKATSRR